MNLSSQSLRSARAGPAQNGSAAAINTEAFIFIHPNRENATCQGITDKLQQPDKSISLRQSPSYSAQSSHSVGAACGSRGSRVPLGEGQASLGEALVSPHMQAAASTTLTVSSSVLHVTIAPEGQTVHGGCGFQCFLT